MDKINNIGLSRLMTNVYDFDGFTEQEIWCRIAQKINIIIEHFNYIDNKINNEIDKNKIKFEYLLGEGLNEQVIKELNKKINDGTLGNIINNTLLSTINEQLKTLNNIIERQLYSAINILLFKGTDITESFQNALNSNHHVLTIPEIEITRPLSIPYNSAKKLVSIGGLKRTPIRVNFNGNYKDRAVFEYLSNEYGEHNWGGVTFEDIHLIGNNCETNGIKLQYAGYILFNNVLIEGFVGSGLILDKCQDSSFNNLIIQDCGRSTGDGTINDETTHAPLEIISTMGNDHNNMLRFRDLQIEENKVSPYIRYADNGGIGIWFDKCHCEVRENHNFNKHDFFECNGGDIEFNNVNLSPTFRNGFIIKGYGNVKFSNCRNLHNVINKGDGVNNSISFLNCGVEKFSVLSALGINNIINSTFKKMSFFYPSGVYNIRDCSIETIEIDYAGVSPRLYFDNVIVDNFYFNPTAKGVIVKNSLFNKVFKFDGVEGECINNEFKGFYSINKIDNIFIEKCKIIYHDGIPSTGVWKKNDKVINTNPSVGSPIGWICLGEGQWKAFGIIME